jgi:hypothetical protein
MEKLYGGKWDLEADPIKHAHLMIAHIDKKRKGAGHRQGQRARPHGYGRPSGNWKLNFEITKSSTKEEKMSKLVAFAAIQGGYNIVSKVEGLGKAHCNVQRRHQGRISQHGLLPAGDLLAHRA